MKTLDSNVIRAPFVAVICISMLVCQFGCTVRHRVKGADIESDHTEAIQPGDEISEVVLKTGEVIVFDKDGGHYLDSSEKQVIQGTSNQGEYVDIAIEDVEEATVRRAFTESTGYSVLVWSAFAMIPISIVLYIWSNMP